MGESTSSAVKNLRNSTARLNQVTDAVSSNVKEIEEILNECSIGIVVSINVPEINKFLSYTRVGERYRIVLKPNGGNAKPWSDCSRLEKLESSKHLPQLIEGLAQEVDKKITDAEKAAETVADLRRTLAGEEI